MIDVLVIGAGIIGSWIAYLASKKGLLVAVCEKEASGGEGTSTRNSGVLHSGIYYPKNSQKLKHCLEGYELSIPFFEKYQIPYLICGKIITIGKTSKEEYQNKEKTLIELYENGKENGLENIEIIKNPKEKYPYLIGDLAIYVPKTGIVDVPTYLKTLWKLCEEQGVIFLNHRKFVHSNGESLLISKRNEIEKIEAKYIINAAGLYSDEIAQSFGLKEYEIRPNKGEYYFLKKSLPYKKLIYPLPSKNSTALGVHYTFNIAGEAYAGPNSIWAKSKEDYKIETSKDLYYESLTNILNFYKKEDLIEGYVGIRPRLFYKGSAITDFVILEYPKSVIHLLGIESPGLTSAPSLAKEIIEKYIN